MTENIKKHWLDKTPWQRLESIGSVAGGVCAILVLLGGCTFGVIKAVGFNVQSPDAKFASLQSAEQADRADIAATISRTQAHEDAIKQLAVTSSNAVKLEPRLVAIESELDNYISEAVREKPKQDAMAADLSSVKATQLVVLSRLSDNHDELKNLHDDVRMIIDSIAHQKTAK